MLESKLDSGNMDLWFKNQFPVHTDQIQVTWTSKGRTIRLQGGEQEVFVKKKTWPTQR